MKPLASTYGPVALAIVVTAGRPAWSSTVPAPPGEARPVTGIARGVSASVQVTELSAWCDHFPNAGAPERRPPHDVALAVSLVVTNTSARRQKVELPRATISFDASSEGENVRGLGFWGVDPTATRSASLTLDQGSSRRVVLRGSSPRPEGRHGQTIFVTLVFRVGTEILTVRASGRVEVTM